MTLAVSYIAAQVCITAGSAAIEDGSPLCGALAPMPWKVLAALLADIPLNRMGLSNAIPLALLA